VSVMTGDLPCTMPGMSCHRGRQHVFDEEWNARLRLAIQRDIH
jgi:hypothetical protein